MIDYNIKCGKPLEADGTYCGNCENDYDYNSIKTTDSKELLVNQSKKSRLTASLLQLFVGFIGFLGLGRLYLGHKLFGVIQLLLSIALFFAGLRDITFFIAVIDCIYVLMRSSLKDRKDKTVPLFSEHSERSRLVAALAQLFFGCSGVVGAGRFYLGHYKYGSAQLVLSFIFLKTGLSLLIYLIAVFDFIYVLCNVNIKDVYGRTVPLLLNSSNSEQNERIDYEQQETILNNGQNGIACRNITYSNE